MKNICKVVAAVVAVVGAVNAHAAIDLRVKGTIVPASCVPSMQGGGIIDYGTIASESLNQTSYTVLEKRK